MATRDEIRQTIFNSTKAKPRSKIVQFMDAEIELRQPAMSVIMEMQQSEMETNLVSMLMQYCYVPGTEERLFDEIDYEALVKLPMNDDFQRLGVALTEMTGMDIKVASKNSEETPSVTT